MGPHYIKTSPHERLTTIAVDPAVSLSNGDSVDVLFIGTNRGRVIKLASFTDDQHQPKTSVIEEMQVFPIHVAVNNILLLRSETDQPRLVVLSDHEVKSLPVQKCRSQATCGTCVGIQDPYCTWNIQQQTCDNHQGSLVDGSSLLQNIGIGFHPGCGTSSYSVPLEIAVGEADQDSFDAKQNDYIKIGENYFENEVPIERPFVKSQYGNEYSEKTLSVACAASAFISLLVGFLGGFLFTKKCASKDPSLKCGHAYLEAQMLERSTKDPSSIYESPYTTHTPSMTTKNNLLSNHPVKSDTQKNNLSVTTNNGTLGKCKKVYI